MFLLLLAQALAGEPMPPQRFTVTLTARVVRAPVRPAMPSADHNPTPTLHGDPLHAGASLLSGDTLHVAQAHQAWFQHELPAPSTPALTRAEVELSSPPTVHLAWPANAEVSPTVQFAVLYDDGAVLRVDHTPTDAHAGHDAVRLWGVEPGPDFHVIARSWQSHDGTWTQPDVLTSRPATTQVATNAVRVPL